MARKIEKKKAPIKKRNPIKKCSYCKHQDSTKEWPPCSECEEEGGNFTNFEDKNERFKKPKECKGRCEDCTHVPCDDLDEPCVTCLNSGGILDNFEQKKEEIKSCEGCDFEEISAGDDPCRRCTDIDLYRKTKGLISVNKLIQGQKTYDSVNNPKHYTSHPSGVECKDISKHFSHPIGSAIEYLWRAEIKHENPIEDCEKAIFWINERIKMLK